MCINNYVCKHNHVPNKLQLYYDAECRLRRIMVARNYDCAKL